MDPQIEFEGKTYRRIGEQWVDATTYIRAPLVIERQLDRLLRASGTAPTPPPKRRPQTISRGDDQSTFRHAETFPIIADIIRTHCRRTGEYISHKEIVQAFLAHPEGHTLAQQAADQQEKPIDRVAGNIVAWFSKRFTEGETPYQEEFERKRFNARWAYRTFEDSCASDKP